MATATKYPQAQTPLILRSQRLMEAFAKSDDERDFYLDRVEGFILYVDLDQSEENLDKFEAELAKHTDRYVMIPKLTYYETKKFMEGFIHEKVYDIDTKEKLLDIISGKEARENFLEFLCDHHSEFEKWQQYYQERSRVRIIEWLRVNHFHFVFEEDLDLGIGLMEKLKKSLFDSKAPKEIVNARKILTAKAKSYYSTEALNPRPKRGRPPKQAAKTEVEPQLTSDIYTTVSNAMRPLLFTPDLSSVGALTFSSKFESEEQLIQRKAASLNTSTEATLENLNQKLAALRSLSTKWLDNESKDEAPLKVQEIEDIDDEDLELDEPSSKKAAMPPKRVQPQAKPTPKAPVKPAKKAKPSIKTKMVAKKPLTSKQKKT